MDSIYIAIPANPEWKGNKSSFKDNDILMVERYSEPGCQVYVMKNGQLYTCDTLNVPSTLNYDAKDRFAKIGESRLLPHEINLMLL